MKQWQCPNCPSTKLWCIKTTWVLVYWMCQNCHTAQTSNTIRAQSHKIGTNCDTNHINTIIKKGHSFLGLGELDLKSMAKGPFKCHTRTCNNPVDELPGWCDDCMGAVSPIPIYQISVKCECGGEKSGANSHSSWCPKFKNYGD